MEHKNHEVQQQGLKLLNKILGKIKSCYPGDCDVYKSEDFNPEDPSYIIGSANDVDLIENESEAKYPVVRLYMDYNDVNLIFQVANRNS